MNLYRIIWQPPEDPDNVDIVGQNIKPGHEVEYFPTRPKAITRQTSIKKTTGVAYEIVEITIPTGTKAAVIDWLEENRVGLS